MMRSSETERVMKMKVVFLDDDINFLNGIKRVLKRTPDWDVATFTDVELLFGELAGGGVNVVISDYRMPGINGLAVLERVRSEYPSVHRVLLSGQATNEVYNEASIIAERYLEKPCDADMILNVINELAGN